MSINEQMVKAQMKMKIAEMNSDTSAKDKHINKHDVLEMDFVEFNIATKEIF